MTAEQELKITWEWEPAESVRTPEHRATWARIEIRVGSDLVTLVEDRGSGSSRRSIYCPRGDDSVHSSRWPIRFLTRGDHRIRSVQVQRELELVVTGTLTRLAEQGVAGTVLEKEWAAIQQTDPDEAVRCVPDTGVKTGT